MNKFKKLAATAVSLVMAGTMAFGLVACGETDGPGGNNPGGSGGNVDSNPNLIGGKIDSAKVKQVYDHMVQSGITGREMANDSGWKTAKEYWKYLSGAASTETKDEYHVRKADGSLDYTKYDSNATLNLAVGHEKTHLSTAYHDLRAQITMPDNNKYTDGDLKPAWAQMSKDLNIKFNDVWDGSKTSKNLENIISKKIDADLFTTDLSVAVNYASANTYDILNLAEYLDYMPHFKEFLEANPVVYLSLLQDGMNTTTGDGRKILVAPYFDGNDDIERYCIMRQDWVKKLLDGTASLSAGASFKSACNDTVAVGSYMDRSGKVTIESTNADGSGKVNIVKNYDAAKAAAADESTPLGEAYKAIAGAVYNGESGNIVDIMNGALTANIEATGDKLADLVRAYIDVCYQKEDGSAYFTPGTRSNLFNGYDACWDVDDLVAVLRLAKTNAATLTGSATMEVEGIVPRSGENDRTPDMVRLACQLYGVRGAESRYEYTYINKNGDLKDARNSQEFFAACARFNLMEQEGLVADYTGYGNFTYGAGLYTSGNSIKGQAMMMYDYSQTQTLNGFAIEDSKVSGKLAPEGYYFAPVVTPVSKWDVDGDGNHTDLMRFTESWRSTKTGGLAVSGSVKNNPAKLKAALQLVDFLYSKDGQLVSTFGPMAENKEGKNGFWYNEPASAAEVEAGKYFTYKGVKYSGTEYKGRYTPTITDALYNSFKGLTVNGFKLADNETASGGTLSFTAYARTLIGSTLPVGVKDQSFENQLTAKMGQVGANKVGTGLANGTIKGMSLDVKSDNYWFTCVPTGLPVSLNYVTTILNAPTQDHLKKITGTGDGKAFYSVMNWIILHGFSENYKQQDEEVTLK